MPPYMLPCKPSEFARLIKQEILKEMDELRKINEELQKRIEALEMRVNSCASTCPEAQRCQT